MDGFYLVYLFASDGSAVYLSLNQGTSEFRSGAMRPINNNREIEARAISARRLLRDFDEMPASSDLRASIDLTTHSVVGVGPESRRRSKNYEYGNIVARRYPALAIPHDQDLLQDLSDMLPMLAVLYEWPVPVRQPDRSSDRVIPDGPTRAASRTRVRTQGRLRDYETRRAIELHAEDNAVAYFEAAGWKVERVGALRLGYDLDCQKEDRGLHVEVKGTQRLDEEVILTRNEVNHHPAHGGRCHEEHRLVVVSEIDVSYDEGPQCEGGRRRVLRPWTPAVHDLIPTEYSYRLP